DRGRAEHGPRLGLARVRRPRARALLSRALTGPAGFRPGAPMRLILASRSPQRRAILEQLGIPFEVAVPDVDELADGPPQELGAENAYRRAAAGAGSGGPGDALGLGGDTIVALGATVYGKPADAGAARETLTALAGRRHTVL